MTELRITRSLDAPPPRVWRAFTTAEGLAAWLWPGSWRTVAEVDLRVGGSYRIASEPMGMAVIGKFVALDAPHRLVQTWRWEGDPGETLVTVTFAPSSTAGTDLTVVHERFDDDEQRDSHLQGWNDCLDRLPGHLTTTGGA